MTMRKGSNIVDPVEVVEQLHVIVSPTVVRARQYAASQGWPAKQCIAVATHDGATMERLRGLRFSGQQIHFVDGWRQGRHAAEVEAVLAAITAD